MLKKVWSGLFGVMITLVSIDLIITYYLLDKDHFECNPLARTLYNNFGFNSLKLHGVISLLIIYALSKFIYQYNNKIIICFVLCIMILWCIREVKIIQHNYGLHRGEVPEEVNHCPPGASADIYLFGIKVLTYHYK